MDKPYTIEVFCGNYDVPVKGADKESQWESEEVYRFLVVAVCPTVGEYEAGTPEAGFLFPAFFEPEHGFGRSEYFCRRWGV